MRPRLLLPIVALGVIAAGSALAARAGGDRTHVTPTIGVNSQPLRTEPATYRLTLAGRAARTGVAPTMPAPAGAVAPGGRYRVDFATPGVTVVTTRTGARRVLTTSAYAARAYWGPAGTLAFTDRKAGLTRLLIFDPETGVRRLVASHLCGDAVVDPWSPDGHSLAIPVSAPGAGCNGRGGPEAAVVALAHMSLRRVAGVPTTPVTWNRDGSRLLIAVRSSDPFGSSRLVDLRTAAGRAVLTSVGALLAPGAWSHGRRFYAALAAVPRANSQAVVIVDGSLRRVIRTFIAAQQFAWSPTRQWLAISEQMQIRVVDAASGRNIAVIPADTPYGLSVQSLTWERSGRAITAVLAPSPGHD